MLRQTTFIMTILFFALTSIASKQEQAKADFQISIIENTGNDTIYTFESPPEMTANIKTMLDTFKIVFERGSVREIERNYIAINKIKNRLGNNFEKNLIKQSKGNKNWLQYFKHLDGKSKSFKNKDNNSVTEFYSFGLAKSRKGIYTLGQIDGLLKVKFEIQFDEKGKCIKNESEKKFTSVF